MAYKLRYAVIILNFFEAEYFEFSGEVMNSEAHCFELSLTLIN